MSYVQNSGNLSTKRRKQVALGARTLALIQRYGSTNYMDVVRNPQIRNNNRRIMRVATKLGRALALSNG